MKVKILKGKCVDCAFWNAKRLYCTVRCGTITMPEEARVCRMYSKRELDGKKKGKSK